jgi:beta-glucosidase
MKKSIHKGCLLSFALMFGFFQPGVAAGTDAAPLPVYNASPRFDEFFTAGMEAAVETVLGQMTRTEKLRMLLGDVADAAPPSRGAAAVKRVGIGAMVFYNGPRGYQVGKNGSTLFPNGTGQAAAFRPELVQEIGASIAREFLADGWQVLEAPSMNIIRDPLNGRNFEYYTEDPLLNSRLTAGFVVGAQRAGAVASAKHFIANNRETNRGQVNAVMDERALREIYLPAFKAACDAGVLSIMTGANRVNGPHASDNPMLISILKHEWGWPGFLYTDWNGVQTTLEAFNAGLDLSMPGKPRSPWSLKELKAADKDGKLDDAALDDKVRRTLRGAYFAGKIPGAPPRANVAPDRAAHHKLALETATAGMVLVRNEKNTLPILPETKQIAVLGPMAGKKFTDEPGGSSGVRTVPYDITAVDGLRKRFGDDRISTVPFSVYELFGPVGSPDVYHLGEKGEKIPGFLATYSGRAPNRNEPVSFSEVAGNIMFNWEMASPDRNRLRREGMQTRWSGILVPPQTGNYTLRIETTFRGGVEIDGDDVLYKEMSQKEQERTLFLEAGREYSIQLNYRWYRGDSYIRFLWLKPDAEARLDSIMEKSAEAARQADVAIVCIGQDHNIEAEGMDRLTMRLPDYQDLLVERVAAANPRTVVVLYGGAPIAMDPWFEKVPALVLPWFPGIENGNALAALLAGDSDFGGRMPITFPKQYEDSPAHPSRQQPDKHDTIEHNEGIFVGYRWFDEKQIDPLIPFGFGLSYTTFAYGEPKVHQTAGKVSVEIAVTNSGKRDGIEVVQLYVHDVEASCPRPPRELKGFQSIRLKPGETKSVVFDLDAGAFSCWNPDTSAWTLEPGDFDLQIARSSRDIVRTARVCIDQKAGFEMTGGKSTMNPLE